MKCRIHLTLQRKADGRTQRFSDVTSLTTNTVAGTITVRTATSGPQECASTTDTFSADRWTVEQLDVHPIIPCIDCGKDIERAGHETRCSGCWYRHMTDDPGLT